ncbi:uncharacterized protein BHQ10_007286 [Talaromyces amestolkiae]|uniref:Uncharacterized protein n=1 Tax=Talaromyces amestolkiae TaxID=1196081 RepID=A0A364L646_TALAM|nr:uncharacterized protein BHQ10_007286 [Talaromyces amestolkiae]RAO71274.1 hypothetical protein BHQ10_007286 [Talaromyces amestolkiae]
MGNNIMLAGLVFQIITLVLVAALCLEFAWRVQHRFPHWKNVEFSNVHGIRSFRGFLLGAIAAFVLSFLRCVYRVVELAGGWNNSLQSEEVPSIILESAMNTTAVFALAVYKPDSAFKDIFGALRASSSASSEENHKAEVVEMQPPSAETPYL